MTAAESPRQAVVARYMDGFRAADHAAVLSTLTDDVVWIVHGARTTRGKAEFDSEIENPHFEGSQPDSNRANRNDVLCVRAIT